LIHFYKSKIGGIKKVDLGQLLSFVLVTEIRNKFQNLWAVESDGIIIVEKVSIEKRKKLEEEGTEEKMAKKLIDKMKGFSKLLQFISDSGKPLIGHNCFLDLVKLFHQFFNHLPVKYKDFKKQIHHLFPIIFDTKNICLNVQKEISKVHPELEHVFTSSNLNELHETLVQRDDKYNLMWSPKIVHADGFTDYTASSTPHEAGYDAFLAGFCFIRTCHLAATISYVDIKRMRVLAFHELLTVVSDNENQINLSRAMSKYINLAGDEPETNRPPFLYVTSRHKSLPLNCSLIAEALSRFACSDIQQISKYEAIIAVSSFRGARDILNKFRHRGDFKIEVYSFLKHSRSARMSLWTGVVMGTLSIFAILTKKFL